MHRELRERQILALLIEERDAAGGGAGGKKGGKGLSPLHIVQRIYDRLPPQVGAAIGAVSGRVLPTNGTHTKPIDQPQHVPLPPPTTTIHPPQVVMSAQWNVEHHLDKLQKEGRASASALGLWQATPQAAMPPREG